VGKQCRILVVALEVLLALLSLVTFLVHGVFLVTKWRLLDGARRIIAAARCRSFFLRDGASKNTHQHALLEEAMISVAILRCAQHNCSARRCNHSVVGVDVVRDS